jgi:glutamate racemase
MIGLFDSGHGGLTVCRALIKRFPEQRFVYLGDHANAPYGNRSSDEIVALTRAGVETLFDQGCRLVVLACNTATSVALRNLQQNWLPTAGREGCNLLGVIAPTVEAATQTPWAVTAPQYPQKYNTDAIAVFATGRTVASNVYPEEIGKRCPKVRVVQQPCPDLAGAIEAGMAEAKLDSMVARYVGELLKKMGSETPDRAILGCTHYPLIEALFARHLPASSRLLSQPETVADSLEDYLARHPHYVSADPTGRSPLLLTTADAGHVRRSLEPFWEDEAAFQPLA